MTRDEGPHEHLTRTSRISDQELNPQAHARVIQLLQRGPDFKPFPKACTWPDHPRTRAHEHFVNLLRPAWTRTGAKDWANESLLITTSQRRPRSHPRLTVEERCGPHGGLPLPGTAMVDRLPGPGLRVARAVTAGCC